MLPPELITSLREHIDIASLYALSQTCSSWRNVIGEHDFRALLHAECPWYEVQFSPRDSWKHCAKIHTLRRRYNETPSALVAQMKALQISHDHSWMLTNPPWEEKFEDFAWPVYRDCVLPHDFHCLEKPIRKGSKWQVNGHGVTFGKYYVDLGEGGFELTKGDSESSFDSENFHTGHGITMEAVVPKEHCRAGSRNVLALLLFEEEKSTLLLKYKGNEGSKPDRIIDTTAYVSEERALLYVSSNNVFIVSKRDKECITYMVDNDNGGCLKVANKNQRRYVPSGMVCYDGIMREINFCALQRGIDISCMSYTNETNEDLSTPFNRMKTIIQDPVHSRYVVLYKQTGVICGIIDLQTRQKMDFFLRSALQDEWSHGHLVMAGVCKGRLALYAFSPSHIKRQFVKQHGPEVSRFIFRSV